MHAHNVNAKVESCHIPFRNPSEAYARAVWGQNVYTVKIPLSQALIIRSVLKRGGTPHLLISSPYVELKKLERLEKEAA